MDRADNRGVTLIELLVSLAVGAIILTGVAYMLVTSLRLYGKTSANAEVQNESQTALNLVLDNVMEAQGICMKTVGSGANTECILLGELLVKEEGTGYVLKYKGNAVVADLSAGEIYLVSFPQSGISGFPVDAGYNKLSGTDPSVLPGQAMDIILAHVLSLSPAEKLPWLMARRVTGFAVTYDTADPGTAIRTESIPEETLNGITTPAHLEYYFKEPFTMTVSLSFQNEEASRTIRDSVSVRNRLETIYIDSVEYRRDRSR